MRPQPKIEPPRVEDVRGQKPAGMVRQVRRYELITPLFGGGVETQQADPITTVRGSEIRGHLRFWWRACRGGRFDGSLKKMKAAEDALWGAAASKNKPFESKVQIVVSDIVAGNIDKPFHVVAHPQNGSPQPRSRPETVVPAYAAFPLQPEQHNIRVGMELPGVQVGVKFTLTITYPQQEQQDVEAALWAWQTFGGIGGRTRRGFGALCCTQINGVPVPMPKADQLSEQIQAQLQQHVSTGQWPADVPHLTSRATFRLTAAKPTALAAWQFLIDRLKSFRQRREQGVDRSRPGRSYWPEPDEIRRRFPTRTPNHKPRSISVAKFPRAAFGLPIVFHFKDENKGEPPETTLQGAQVGRLASPLILRPIRCNQDAVGIGLILEGSRGLLNKLKLDSKGKNKPVSKPIETQLTREDAASEPLFSLLKGNPDVLFAFLDTL